MLCPAHTPGQQETLASPPVAAGSGSKSGIGCLVGLDAEMDSSSTLPFVKEDLSTQKAKLMYLVSIQQELPQDLIQSIPEPLHEWYVVALAEVADADELLHLILHVSFSLKNKNHSPIGLGKAPAGNNLNGHDIHIFSKSGILSSFMV